MLLTSSTVLVSDLCIQNLKPKLSAVSPSHQQIHSANGNIFLMLTRDKTGNLPNTSKSGRKQPPNYRTYAYSNFPSPIILNLNKQILKHEMHKSLPSTHWLLSQKEILKNLRSKTSPATNSPPFPSLPFPSKVHMTPPKRTTPPPACGPTLKWTHPPKCAHQQPVGEPNQPPTKTTCEPRKKPEVPYFP